MSDEKRRRRERKAQEGDDAEAVRLAADEARLGRAPMIRLRLDDYRQIVELDNRRDLGDVLHEVIEAGVAARRRGDGLRARDALALLTLALVAAGTEQAEAVDTVLRLGAGHLYEPGVTHSTPAGLARARRRAWVELAESIRLDSVGVEGRWDDDATWTPTEAGDWESVLATLVVQRRWEEIERAARDLEGKR